MGDNLESSKQNEIISYKFIQLGFFIVIFILILVRAVTYKDENNQWIWIINYIGMGIAIINLFIAKCFKLKDKNNKNHKKYKPFVGFTIVVMIVVFIMAIPTYMAQSKPFSQCVNDIITLLALFFSLSRDIWNSILNLIVVKLKR